MFDNRSSLVRSAIRFSLSGLIACVLLCSSSFAKTNVILMIVDGGGFGAYRVGSQFQTGEDQGMFYMNPDNGWTTLGCTTYSLNGSFDQTTIWDTFNKHFDKPTDSAASATAINTGVKTDNGRLSVDHDGKQLETIAEHAVSNGYAAGAMSNVMPSHATPAAVAAHNPNRSEGENLFKQMIEGKTLSVIIGAVHPYFDRNGERLTEPSYNDYGPNPELWAELLGGKAPNGWTYIENREDFQKIASGETAAPNKLLGIAQVAMTFQSSRSSKMKDRIDNVPTMTEAALAAINVLNQNEKGFYLMIESGSVDWVGKLDRCCEEMTEYNQMVEAICAWVEKNSSWDETLLILTADHETGGVFGPDADKDQSLFQTPINQGKGNLPLATYHAKAGHHTNAPVPVFVKGNGAAELIKRVRHTDSKFGKIWNFDGRCIDNTDFAPVAKELFK